ncbi:hypothetical protein DVH05_006797 [Phytophthora capsici]|nr:hypothetical protein DVH05_006797 [Phytophthora capsici]
MLRSMVQPEEKVDEAKQPSSLTCRLANCNVSFQSVTAYEEHYDMMHRNVCRECSRSFLSLRLLDIHISETHDAFFKILSKKKPMYVCLVDGCPETFQHDDKRTRHLVQVHQYPESFSFHKRKAKGKTINREETNEPEVNTETIKKREARKRRRQQKKKKLMQEKLQSSDMQVDAEAEMLGVCHNEIASCEPTDVDMVELEESMRQLRIPNSIRFGRKRRV